MLEPVVLNLAPLTELLQQFLATHQRLLSLARSRQEAMRTYDVARLNELLERERQEAQGLEKLERQRKGVLIQLRLQLGMAANPTVSQIAERCGEPARSQLLGLAGTLKATVEELGRINRINAKVSQGVAVGLARVLSVMTGLAQHAGMYMANGRKAVIRGIHLLDALA